MSRVLKVKTVRSTWLERSGVSTTHHLDSKLCGRRIVVHQWEGETVAEIKLIDGDGRGLNYRIFECRTVPQDLIADTVAAMCEA